jgi:hypothetical protein
MIIRTIQRPPKKHAAYADVAYVAVEQGELVTYCAAKMLAGYVEFTQLLVAVARRAAASSLRVKVNSVLAHVRIDAIAPEQASDRLLIYTEAALS